MGFPVLDVINTVATVAQAIYVGMDYHKINPHEMRVQRGFDNIAKSLVMINENLLSIASGGRADVNDDVIKMVCQDDEAENGQPAAYFIRKVNSSDLLVKADKIVKTLNALMSKTARDPDELIFSGETKNADNIETKTISANIDNANFKADDLVNVLKLKIGDKEYSLTEVLYNLLRVTSNSDFSPDNISQCLLALGAGGGVEAIAIKSN